REAGRFLASLEQLENEVDLVPEPGRKQNRQTEDFSQPSAKAFANAADSDPDLPAHRDPGPQILAPMATPQPEQPVVGSHRIESEEQLDATITAAQQAGSTCQDLPLPTRSQVLIRVGDHLAAVRDELIEVMGAETGKTIDQSDPEVSEAIDFARFYAEQCLQ